MTRRGRSKARIWLKAGAALLLGAGVVAAGCTATAAKPKTVASAASVVDPTLRVGVLTPRELPSGQCGLFLWSRTQDPQLVFFNNPAINKASMVFDNKERSLTRTSVTPSTAEAPNGAQLFATATGDLSVEVTIKETEEIDRGMRIPNASLRVQDAKGWSTLVAAAGLAACQP